MTRSNPRADAPPAADMAQTATTALLSHDIRAALAGILSAGQALETSAGLKGENAALLAQITAAATYINDLLNMAAQAPDAGNPAQSVSELAPLLTRLETLWKAEAAGKGLGFSITRKGVIPSAIRLPEIDFLRIFNNIIGNALKFAPAGALILRLSRGQNGALLVEVLDEGPGFSPEALARLFSRHGRPPGGALQSSGAGHGLYIASQLVARAGGEIRAENRPAGGARVVVTFPEDLLIMAEKPPTRPDTGLPDLSHLNILLAEDNPTNQMVATQMLRKMGAKVACAADGVEAMAAFESGTFTLGLIDIEMPRKSGLEVLREMRARADAKAETPLLALTAYVLPEHKERIMAAGADGIIAKPLTDVAAFGNAILLVTGAPPAPATPAASAPAAADPAQSADTPPNPDAEIQMDVYQGLREIIGPDSMRELLTKVKNDLSSVAAGLKDGAEAQDPAPIRANTHILVSVAGAFGAVNLQHLAEALNTTAKTGDWARILPQTRRCQAGVSDVLAFVNGELEALGAG